MECVIHNTIHAMHEYRKRFFKLFSKEVIRLLFAKTNTVWKVIIVNLRSTVMDTRHRYNTTRPGGYVISLKCRAKTR